MQDLDNMVRYHTREATYHDVSEHITDAVMARMGHSFGTTSRIAELPEERDSFVEPLPEEENYQEESLPEYEDEDKRRSNSREISDIYAKLKAEEAQKAADRHLAQKAADLKWGRGQKTA